MKSILRAVVNTLFPKKCSGCENLLADNEHLLCSYCRFELPKTHFLFQKENQAFKKFYGIIPVDKVAALIYFEKNGITQHILHHLKYKHQPELGVLLANMFEDDLNRAQFFDPDCCLIPVPLHPKRYKQRGYNQVQLFTETLAKNHGIAFDSELLIRTVYKKTQTKKNLEQRNTAQTSVFNLSTKLPTANHLVLIDDVLTTGATLIQCCKALQQIPNIKISILTVAFAV